MNLANMITTLRFFLIPLYIYTFFASVIQNNLLVSTFVFIFAGVTDVLDGHIARKYDMVTKYGTALDPLADKLMQTTVLICLAIGNYIPICIPILLIAKEMLMIIGGLFLYLKGEKTVIPANKYGKLSTAVFYLTVVIIASGISRILSYSAIAVMVLFMTVSFINYYFSFKEVYSNVK